LLRLLPPHIRFHYRQRPTALVFVTHLHRLRRRSFVPLPTSAHWTTLLNDWGMSSCLHGLQQRNLLGTTAPSLLFRRG
jgi:hypothetical protein